MITVDQTLKAASGILYCILSLLNDQTDMNNTK